MPTNPNRRRAIWTLKAAFTAVVIYWLTRRVDMHALGRTLTGLSAQSLILLVSFALACLFLATWRYSRILGFLGLSHDFFPLLREQLVGLAGNLFLPASVGGDAVRAVRLGAVTRHDGAVVWASVLYERLVGLAAMLAVALAALALSPHALGARAGLVPPVVLVVLVVVLFVAPPRIVLWAQQSRGHLGIWAERVESLAGAFAGPLVRPRVVGEIFAISIVNQLLALGALYFPARALGLPQPALVVFLGVPIVFVGAALPITFGGHGLRESLFVAVLGLFGVDPTRALGLAMVWLGLNVTYALFGVGFLVLGRPPEPLQFKPEVPGVPVEK